MMQELIKVLKKDLPQDKQKIVDILLAQLDAYDYQLQKIKTDTHYLEQLRLIEEMESKVA